jgi:hypothetical protein
MRFSVDRICELAGIGSETGSLLSEAAVPAMTPAAKPAVAPPKPGSPMAKLTAPAAKPAPAKPAAAAPAKAPAALEGDYIEDEAMYEIDETELMEALVDMRQTRLEESTVRDAVRDEIKRALSDKSGSWIYGGNKPTASRNGQVARGGFGVGFGFRR